MECNREVDQRPGPEPEQLRDGERPVGRAQRPQGRPEQESSERGIDAAACQGEEPGEPAAEQAEAAPEEEEVAETAASGEQTEPDAEPEHTDDNQAGASAESQSETADANPTKED